MDMKDEVQSPALGPWTSDGWPHRT